MRVALVLLAFAVELHAVAVPVFPANATTFKIAVSILCSHTSVHHAQMFVVNAALSEVLISNPASLAKSTGTGDAVSQNAASFQRTVCVYVMRACLIVCKFCVHVCDDHHSSTTQCIFSSPAELWEAGIRKMGGIQCGQRRLQPQVCVFCVVLLFGMIFLADCRI